MSSKSPVGAGPVGWVAYWNRGKAGQNGQIEYNGKYGRSFVHFIVLLIPVTIALLSGEPLVVFDPGPH